MIASIWLFSELTLAMLSYRSCAVDSVLHEEEEEVNESREQPQLLEQRHHYGLLQQTRCRAAQRDPYSGERGTNH